MSDTPRTDALLLQINEGRKYEHDGPVADFARELERSLAAAIQERDAARLNYAMEKTETDALRQRNEELEALLRDVRRDVVDVDLSDILPEQQLVNDVYCERIDRLLKERT